MTPQSLDAERALLGGLLMDNGQVAAVAEVLMAGDFYHPGHALIWALMLERFGRSQPLDVLGLCDHLRATGQVETAGGLAYVAALPEHVATVENLGYYAAIVREKAVRRRLLQVCGDIGERVRDGSTELPALLDFAERTMFEVAQQQERRDWHALRDIIDAEWTRMERLSERSGVTGLPTGFSELDRMLAGLQRSDLLILAARPAMGKTALALNIAQNVALLTGAGVGVFSLEMSRGQLVTRLLCSQGRVDAGRVRTGQLGADDRRRLEDASEVLYHAPLWIDDTPGLTITQLRSKARRLATQTGNLGLIVVDYLQLMEVTGERGQNREQGISQISRGLKALAKELDIPILALSQLNRSVEARNPKIPLMSDLRESGAIEQDADIVMFIYREEYYREESARRGEADVIIAKQRNGPTGTVALSFQGRFTRFDNLSRPAPDDRREGWG